MSRPPETKKGAKTKMFKVAPGFSIGGYDGQRKNAGDDIELTHAQAKYFFDLNAIKLTLEEFEDDDATEAELPAAENPKKGSPKPKADGAGKQIEGGSAGTPAL